MNGNPSKHCNSFVASSGEMQLAVGSYLMVIQCVIAVVMKWFTLRPRRFDMLSATYMTGLEEALGWRLTDKAATRPWR